nr:Hcp family type VI secretion system effector [uncultured Pseudomonas sp.]
MAFLNYLTLTGRQQGLISAGCSTEPSVGNRYQSDHCDEIMVLSFEHQMLNLDNTHRTTHQAVSLTKLIDKSTPLIAQALTNREVVDCVFEFYRLNANGKHEKYFKIKLSNGMILKHRLDMPNSILMGDQDALEQIAISYQHIDWHHYGAGTSGHAAWGELAW